MVVVDVVYVDIVKDGGLVSVSLAGDLFMFSIALVVEKLYRYANGEFDAVVFVNVLLYWLNDNGLLSANRSKASL